MRYLNLINTESTTSEFEAYLPGNLTLGKNAKIALEQINLTFTGDKILIDDTNNTFEFTAYARTQNQVRAGDMGGYARKITIPTGSYYSREEFLRVIQDEINACMPLYSNFNTEPEKNNYVGLQFNLLVNNQTEKLNLNYAHADIKVNLNILRSNYSITETVGGVDNWAVKNAGAETDFNGFTQSLLPLSRSNGKIEIKTVIQNDATFNTSEFIVGVTKKKVNDGTILTLDDFLFAVYSVAGNDKFRIKCGNINENFRTSANAEFTKNANNTNIAITWGGITDADGNTTGGGVKFGIQSNVNLVQRVNYSNVYELDKYLMTDSKNYLTIAAKQNDKFYYAYNTPTEAANLKAVYDVYTTIDPITNNTLRVIPDNVEHNDLGLSYVPNNRYFKFTSELNRMLGFNMQNFMYHPPGGDSMLESDEKIDGFIKLTGFGPKNLVVEVPSLDIESYQNFGFKKNIIASIPNLYRENYDLSYKVHEKVFVNLRNKDIQDLSSIRIKVTNERGDKFNVDKDTLNLTLVIDDEF